MGSLFGGAPKPPPLPAPPPPPPVVPEPDEDAALQASRRAQNKMRQRSGRQATILSDAGGGATLGAG